MYKEEGNCVKVTGFVKRIKILGKIAFVIVKDRDHTYQLTIKKESEFFDIVKKLTLESYVYVEGIEAEKKAKVAEKEIIPKKMEFVLAKEPLPIDTSGKIENSPEKRYYWRYLDLRIERKNIPLLVRGKIQRYVLDFFDENSFVIINTPKITKIGAESGAEVFHLNYFGDDAVLAQSPQLYKQMAIIAGLEKVVEIGPVFRAEKSHTTRHLAEFTGLDVEMEGIKNVGEIEAVLEDMLNFVFKKLKEKWKLKEDKPLFERISLKKAKEILEENYEKKLPPEEDLDSEGERLIGMHFAKEGINFVFIEYYPWEKRPFYHMKKDEKTTKSFDLIYKGVEITTGAVREHRYEVLRKQILEKGLNPEDLKVYLDMFLYGAPPHGGFGFGLDRFVEKLLDLENIRDACFIPRSPERLIP